MSAYAGNFKTSYGAQGGDDAGGFPTGSQQGSQGGGAKSAQDESLRPVTVKQILDADEAYSGADFKIDGATVTQVTFIGQLRSVNPSATNTTLKIDDGTGQIEVKKWNDADKEDPNAHGFELDSHLRIWGRVKSFNNKRHIAANIIRPVADMNEVNYHMLESTYVHLFFANGPLGGAANGGAAGGEDSMFVDGGNGYAGAMGDSSKLSAVSAQAKRVFSFLSQQPGANEGVHTEFIAKGTNLSIPDAHGVLTELSDHGLIYTTIDDSTWAMLD